MRTTILPPVGPNQIQPMGIDFNIRLPAGVTLTGSPTLTLSAPIGTDPAPQSRIVNGPTIGTMAAPNGYGTTDTSLLWEIATAQPGVTYLGDLYCPRSDGGQVEEQVVFECPQIML